MTYKTRQEVLRAAADWMDVCEKAGIEAYCKCEGTLRPCNSQAFYEKYSYEFPIALLEGKEVWVDSELYDEYGRKYVVSKDSFAAWGRKSTWNQPKPKTVMVELAVEDAEKMSRDANEWLAGTSAYDRVGLACKKALEKL